MEIKQPIGKCLLITPLSFYSYTSYVRNELIRQGFQVTVSNHEYPDSMFGKIMGKLKIPLLLLTTRKTIGKKFLKDATFDVVLIIKGRGMSKLLIHKFLQQSNRVIAYNFDSFEYNPSPLNWFRAVSRYYTFDYRDAANHKLPVVELFTSLAENKNPKQFKYDISAIVRNHSHRIKFIDKVFTLLPVTNRFIYIYEQNIFTFLINFLRNPALYTKYRKHISFKSLPFEKYSDVLYNSDFTIDCVHPTQSGISIRCFEALSSQTKIITNNEYVFNYDRFDSKNVIVVTAKTVPEEMITQYQLLKYSTPVKFRRSIEMFIDDLLK